MQNDEQCFFGSKGRQNDLENGFELTNELIIDANFLNILHWLEKLLMLADRFGRSLS